MAVTEIYIKLVVGFPNDPKVRALARYGIDGILARDLYTQMALHCRDNLTDGFVPDFQVGVLVYPIDPEHGKQLAKHLVSVGLTKEASKDGADGWQVLAYLKRNPSKAEVEELSKVRAQAGSKGGRKSRKRPAQKPSRATSKQVAYQGASTLPSRDRDRDRVVTEPSNEGSAAASGNGLSVTQRSKRITDAYAEAEPMCRWPAVNNIVIKAIQAARWTDDEIRDALLRMAAEGRPVTVDSLRIELDGLPGLRRPAATQSTGADRARAARDAGARVQAMLDAGGAR